MMERLLGKKVILTINNGYDTTRKIAGRIISIDKREDDETFFVSLKVNDSPFILNICSKNIVNVEEVKK
jgi:hypothetical protein